MASPEETREIVDRVLVVQMEAEALANKLQVRISFESVLEGLMLGLRAAEDSNLNPGEILDSSSPNVILDGKDETGLRGLFIGALMVPYVLGAQGESHV